MNTLIWFVVLYWIISVGIGIYAARYVRNSKDYAIAGRSLPMSVVTATVFATWFGSEAVLGIPATFVKEGFTGVIADPFGSAMCLVLVGILFAKRLYRMNLMTISDYYRNRYGRTVRDYRVALYRHFLSWLGRRANQGARSGVQCHFGWRHFHEYGDGDRFRSVCWFIP